ncbi:MAG TPA: M15 family metallopeptidase [Myxococcaceae bacterium]
MGTDRQMVEAWERGQVLGTIAVVGQDGVLMEVQLAAAWGAMRDAAAAAGVSLVPTSGFRTMEEQQRLWAEHLSGQRPTPVARPGFSNHQNGRALDITVHDSTTSAEYRWLDAHARAFGFRNVGAGFSRPEWWHWEWSATAESLAA